MQDGRRERWVDNLKIMACLAVFWGHFYSSFYGQLLDKSFLERSDNIFIFFIQHVLNIVVNGGWWVFAFCIISGWLAWKKEIHSGKDLLKVLLHRYLRFFIPVLIANLFVVIISKTIGYHAFEVGSSINNDWLGGTYRNPPQLSRIFLSALILSNEFVGALWVLPYIFVGTCIVYFLKYIAVKTNLNNWDTCLALLALWPIYYWLSYKHGSSWFYSAVTIAGILLGAADIREEQKEQTRWIPGLGIIGVTISLNIWSLDKVWSFVSALFFLIFSLKCEAFRELLEKNKLISGISHLSFVVYLLHGPLLFSVSMLIYKRLIELGLTYSATAIINLILSTMVVIVVSECYYRFIEKKIDLLIKKI